LYGERQTIMKGLVKYELGEGFVELREIEEKDPAPHEVKIEVRAAGICGSDLHILHGDINIPVAPPVVIGHEFSGVVVQKGAEVGDEIEIGARVTGEPSAYVCGSCRYCRSEYYNLCPERRIIGYTADGCFAPYCNAVLVHRLPDGVNFKAASITEPLACAVHGVIEQTGISAGDSVAVLGPGPLGLLAAQVARAEGGIVTVCGIGQDRERLRLADSLGMHRTVNTEAEDALQEMRDATGGYGADVVLECSGSEQAVRLGLEMVRKRGKYTQMGLFGRTINVDFEKIAFKEIRLSGFVSQRRPAWKRALALMEHGVIDTEKIITHEFPLTEWEDAFRSVEEKKAVKAVLNPKLP
jgi:L-iditol 2-dehydrogenase